jgi:hypothetical protein
MPFSRSSEKLSGITLRTTRFIRSTPFWLISRARLISSSVTSIPATATIPLLRVISICIHESQRHTCVTCTPIIFSASPSATSRLALNSSMSSILPFRIPRDSADHTPSMRSFLFSPHSPMTVLIRELPISMATKYSPDTIYCIKN